jgi:hypothetical protein
MITIPLVAGSRQGDENSDKRHLPLVRSTGAQPDDIGYDDQGIDRESPSGPRDERPGPRELMDFDTDRVMQTIEELGSLRYGGPEAEIRRAEFLARNLESSGWQVELREVAGSSSAALVRVCTGHLGLGLGMTLTLIFLRQDAPVFWQLLSGGLALAWYAVFLYCLPRRPWSTPPIKRVPLCLGCRRTAAQPGSRVVIQAALGPIEDRLARFAGSWLERCLLSFSLMLLCSVLPGAAGGLWGKRTYWEDFGWFCLASIWVMIVVGLFRLIALYRAGPGPGDRSGLAVLLELARTWPKYRANLVEMVFAAVGGQDLDQAGEQALLRILGTEWARKPTLVIVLASPGIGQELLLAGSQTKDLAKAAATSLWVPHRLAAHSESPREVRTRGRELCEKVVLSGDRWSRQAEAVVDAKALRGTGQLVAEIALRWARRQGKPSPGRANT